VLDVGCKNMVGFVNKKVEKQLFVFDKNETRKTRAQCCVADLGQVAV
jgi:hypothetical protein